jgi:hypothetical protein
VRDAILGGNVTHSEKTKFLSIIQIFTNFDDIIIAYRHKWVKNVQILKITFFKYKI